MSSEPFNSLMADSLPSGYMLSGHPPSDQQENRLRTYKMLLGLVRIIGEPKNFPFGLVARAKRWASRHYVNESGRGTSDIPIPITGVCRIQAISSPG